MNKPYSSKTPLPTGDPPARILAAVLAACLLSACSVKQMALEAVADELSRGGGVFASDDDPELIREALPFGLKTYESLLEATPEHRGLLLATAKGYTAYAYILQDRADRLEPEALDRARALRRRARTHYLRGRDYGLRGLEVAHPGFARRVREAAPAALASAEAADVDLLYWCAAAWAGALSVAKDDLDLIAELPISGALMARVLELDETYDAGAAHEFFIAYEGGRPNGSARRAREHYRRALELSGGARASAHLALAESVVVDEQNLTEFRALIAATLAVDPDRFPELRLVNTIARDRARRLERRIPELFFEAETEEVTS